MRNVNYIDYSDMFLKRKRPGKLPGRYRYCSFCLFRRRSRHFGMRSVVLAGATTQRIQTGGHHCVGEGDGRCHAKAAADTDGLAMHEAEIGEDGTDQREGRRLLEIAFDDEDTDRTQDEATEDGAATHHFEAVIEHALLRQRGD